MDLWHYDNHLLRIGGPPVEWFYKEGEEPRKDPLTGTHFTCFTSTEVRILTPEELRGRRQALVLYPSHERMLTYADVCRSMLTYADVYRVCRHAAYPQVCQLLVYAAVSY